MGKSSKVEVWHMRYISALALMLGEKEKLKTVLTEFKKLLPKASEAVDYEKMIIADYHRIVKEAELENEGF